MVTGAFIPLILAWAVTGNPTTELSVRSLLSYYKYLKAAVSSWLHSAKELLQRPSKGSDNGWGKAKVVYMRNDKREMIGVGVREV